jgi:hypothetical protein
MKKIIQLTCLVFILGFVLPLSAKNNSLQYVKQKTLATTDFIAYNSTSSYAIVSLYNTNTDTWIYFYAPPNTPPSGTVIGQLELNDDIYSGSVQMLDTSLHTIQLYFTYGENVNYVYGTDMALGCGACANVRIY